MRFFKPTMVQEALYEYRVSSSSVSLQHAEHQSAATAIVRDRFAALDISDSLPRALAAFAQTLELSMLAAGRLAHTIWQNPAGSFALPEGALAPLAAILPDRILEPADRAVAWWAMIDEAARPGTALKGIAAKPYR